MGEPAGADAAVGPTVAGVILAAGVSSRMGENKLLLPVRGEAMVAGVVRRALGAGLSPVVVVLGHEPERVRAALVEFDVFFVTSPDPTGPTSSSLHAGIRALGTSVTAAVVLLADMVHVSEEMIRALTFGSSGGAPLEVSQYGEVFAPPLLFTRRLWPELLAWKGEGCGKSVVLSHRSEAGIHRWPVEALRDVDTPSDYADVSQ